VQSLAQPLAPDLIIVCREENPRRVPEAVLLPGVPWSFRDTDCTLFAETQAGRRGRMR
jgi:hypothetical protein